MGFLDNLENSLKSLESREERDPNEGRRRESDRARTLAAAPWAEQLKNSEYTKDLFDKAAAAGHRIRAKVYMAWFDTTLRLEARGRTLELRPTPDGIVAHFVTEAGETAEEPVDLSGDPNELLNRWLGQEQARPRVAAEEE
jgi:hypothetical protein